jgi:Helix-turn-helix domain
MVRVSTPPDLYVFTYTQDCPMDNRVLYTITEARNLLGGISRNSIYSLLRHGQLESVVIGCRRFIARAAIDALIEKSTTTESPSVDSARLRKPDQNDLPLPLPPTGKKRRKDGESE